MSNQDMDAPTSSSRPSGHFDKAKQKLKEVQREWTIEAMPNCIAVCHPVGGIKNCSICDAYCDHVAEAASKAAIILDPHEIKDNVFEAFSDLEWEFICLEDKVEDMEKDFESLHNNYET